MYCIYCGKKNEEYSENCVECNARLLPEVLVKNLQYQLPEANLYEELKNIKVGFFQKSDFKKFLASIEDGEMGFVMVKLERIFEKSVTNNDDIDYFDYGNIKTVDGSPCAEAVRVADYELKQIPEDGAVEEKEAYILRYKIKKNTIYLLVKENTTEYLKVNIKDFLDITHTELIDRNKPPREGSIGYKISKGADKILGKIFKE